METLSPSLDEAAIQHLRASLRGTIVRPGGDDYEAARRIWNGMIDRKPALIARCAATADVINAINFARTHHLLVSVRGGGHSFAGFSTCDDGLVIDLSPMNRIQVNPEARLAQVEGGVTWGAFDAATHAHGLGTTGGLMSTTGVAGLTLGGGIGWLMRNYGLACDNLLGIELVTAQGEVIRANNSENQELFWGLRGGGGNFGIVTTFWFQLHPVSTVTGGLMLFPGTRTPEILRFYRDYIGDLPDDFTTMLSAITAPNADFFPQDLRGRPAMVLAGCHCGDPDQAERMIKPVRNLGPALDMFGSMPYPQLQTLFDEDLPYGIRCYVKAGYCASLSEAAIECIAEHTRTMTSAASTFDFHHMGGAVSRVSDDATAFGDRQSAFCFNIVGLWNEPTEDETHRNWVREFASALEPFGTGGVYVNFTADADRVRAAYGDEKYKRLQRLKQHYDPTNLFHLNQNIKPTL
jgi:FAD/FMN-containing dehydrogenase